jgi:hypothetical protein
MKQTPSVDREQVRQRTRQLAQSRSQVSSEENWLWAQLFETSDRRTVGPDADEREGLTAKLELTVCAHP